MPATNQDPGACNCPGGDSTPCLPCPIPHVDLTYNAGADHFTLRYLPGFLPGADWATDCGTVAHVANSRYVLGCTDGSILFENVFYATADDCAAGTPISAEGPFEIDSFTCDPFVITFTDGSTITL
jgi:hypothetical protein